jgi:Flp pilus assembly protein TadD
MVPANALVLNNLAFAYQQKGDPRALETSRQAYERAKGDPRVMDTYGWLLTRAGRAKEAVPVLRAAVMGAPSVHEIRYHYAVALHQSGDAALARIILADLLQYPIAFEGRPEAQNLLAQLP